MVVDTWIETTRSLTNRLSGAEATRLIATLASMQYGVVAHWQLIDLGLGRRLIHTRQVQGELIPLYRGVYAVGHEALSRNGEIMAAALAAGRSAIISHATAAEVWGLRGRSRQFELTRPSGGGRRGRLYLHQAKLDATDVSSRGPLRLTSVPRTLLDLAHRLDGIQLKRAVVAAERQQLLDWNAVDRLLTVGDRRPGIGSLRLALAEADPRSARTEPGAEELFLVLWRQAGHPMPEINVRVGRFIVDFLWPEAKVIVECDGYHYHRGRIRFEEDRDRDMELRAAGYEVHRVTFRMLQDHPDKVIATIRESIRRRIGSNQILSP